MKIINTKSLKKTRFLEMVVTNYINTVNKPSQWWWVRRPKGVKAVVIVAVNQEDKLVVTKEFRVPVQNYEIGFPAGLIDAGESPEDAVRRELEEETGLIVEEVMHISPEVLSSAGLTNEAVHLAYVKVSGEPNKDKLEASEDIDTMLLTQSEVTDLLFKANDDDYEYSIGKLAYAEMKNFSRYGEI